METINKNFINTQLALLLKSDVNKFGKSVNSISSFNNLPLEKSNNLKRNSTKKWRSVIKTILYALKLMLIFIFKVFYYVLLFSFYIVFYTFKFWFFVLKIIFFPILALFAIFTTQRELKTFKRGNKRAKGKPHYGYRYGRWYYGHNHVEGCEFGDSTCSGGRN